VSETSRSIFNALRLTLRAQPRSEELQIRTPPVFTASHAHARCAQQESLSRLTSAERDTANKKAPDCSGALMKTN
jgi:hypothetical protein